MTTATSTNGTNYSVIGYRESGYDRARFDIDNYMTNVDWPTASRFLADHGVKNPTVILRLALDKYDFQQFYA